MRNGISQTRRRGSIIPLLALTVVGLFGFTALAIDLGVLTIVRTNCQNAADSGALAGCRQLNNKPSAVSNDSALAISTATTTTTNNKSLTTQLTTGNIASGYPKVGVYQYDTTSQKFAAAFPTSLPTGQSWTAVQVNVTTNQPTFFARVFGVNSMPAAASAIAVHRPRDIALILDFSSSMQFGSEINWENGFGGSNGNAYGMLNPDQSYPAFGYYQRYTNYNGTTLTSTAAGSGTVASRPNPLCAKNSFQMSSGEVAAASNLTVETGSGPPMILDFRFDPSNVSNPTNKVTTPNSTNLYSAFNRWMKIPPSVENIIADSSYRPPVTGSSTLSLGTGSATIRTFDFTGYDAYDTTSTNGPVPAPENFDDQADTPIKYVGDKWARKGGAKPADSGGAAANWDNAAATGASVTAQDTLGYLASNAYSPGAATPTSAILTPFGNNWTNFRDPNWETKGYDLDIVAYVANRATVNLRVADLFQGFSMGPAYYGKTFFMWPPDPRYTTGADPTSPSTSVTPRLGAMDSSGRSIADWRRRFFLKSDGTAFDPQADNNSGTAGTQSINQVLFNATSGGQVLNTTANSFTVNYPAILAWIKSGPQVLPPNLRAGRVVYYTSIPSVVTSASTDTDQRFWREYIDYVLGFTGNSTNNDSTYTLAGYEPKSWPEGVAVSIGATAAYNANPKPYMNYTDNPNRPRVHFWFGPYTMLTFISSRQGSGGRRFATAGTVHEAQSWQLKAAMNSAFDDIRNNHPNDYCGMTYFAYANYRTTRAGMGQDWTTLKNALFYPNSLLSSIAGGNTTTELVPFDSSLNYTGTGNVPNANGGTDPGTGFALAYNLLSSSTTMSPAGTGRRGASKIVIFETDGVPNSLINWNYTSAGYNSYYSDGGNGSGSASTAMTQCYNIIDQIMATPATGTTGTSGFNASGAPAKIHAIAFGDLFSIFPYTAPASAGLAFLGTVQYKGKTQSADVPIASSNIVTGDYTTRISTLKTLMQRIMQSGIQVTLVQ